MIIQCKICTVSGHFSLICNKCYKKQQKKVTEQNKRSVKTGTLTIEDWLISLEKHNFCCAACKSKCSYFTLDHIIPMSKGGSNNKDNIQPLCKECHEFKGTIETKLKGNKKKRLEAQEMLCYSILEYANKN